MRRVKVKALRCPISEIKFLRRFLRKLARPGTRCDRSLMRPVTAPCGHFPPTLAEILDVVWVACDRQGWTRPALTRHGDGRRVPARAFPPVQVPVLPSGRLSCHGPAARVSTATGREGNEPHQRRVRAPVRRANESPSVMHVYDQQRRTFREAVCEELAKSSRWRRSIATSQGRHHINRNP